MIHQLAIIERQEERDDVEGSGGEWAELTTAYINLAPLNGRERLIAAQTQAHTTHKITGHYGDLKNVLPEDRLKIAKLETVDEDDTENDVNFRIFHIESMVNVNEMNREIELLVVERV